MRSQENATRPIWYKNLLNQPGLQDGWIGTINSPTPGSIHLLPSDLLTEHGLNASMAVLVLRIQDTNAIMCPVFMWGTGLARITPKDRWLGIHNNGTTEYCHDGLLQIRTGWTAGIPTRKLGLSLCVADITKLFNRTITNKELGRQIKWGSLGAEPMAELTREMWRSIIDGLTQRAALPSWLTIATGAKPFVPLFGEHNMNKEPEETGCDKSGYDGLVCCCKRTCPVADSDQGETEERFFTCGIVRVERSWSNQGDVGYYHGINSDGGKHHLGEMASGTWAYKRLCGVHNRRRLKKH